MFPIEKYKFFKTTSKNGGTKVIAVSTFAGKPVRGVAVCDTKDEFNEQKGKELAAARCAVRIAQKRRNRALAKYTEAQKILVAAADHMDQMRDYKENAALDYDAAQQYLEDLLTNM